MKTYIRTLLGLVAFLSFVQAHAAVTPLAFGIAPPVQFPPKDFTIAGARISALYGEARDLYGVDVGLLGNITDGEFKGLAVAGLFNATKGTTDIIGLQLAGITNINTSKTMVAGIQATLGINYNSAASTLSGLELAGLANISPFMDVYGAQVALYNRAKDVYGLQIGLVNIADNLHGVQIGLVNFNHKGPFAISPFLNVGF
jgi:hypothetical protein